jgi:hypothetical protein
MFESVQGIKQPDPELISGNVSLLHGGVSYKKEIMK